MKTVSVQDKLEHRFNDDLLLDPANRKLMQGQFKDIYHVLDNPELRTEFKDYDEFANTGKIRVQIIGLLSVALATIALLFSAMKPLLLQMPDMPKWLEPASVYAEAGGLLGALIAAGGLWITDYRRRWLQARMMAELLRLWHFQTFVCLGKEIEQSVVPSSPGASELFRKERAARFRAFSDDWSRAADARLEQLIGSPEEGYQLLHCERSTYPPGSGAVGKVFEAYRLLRFRKQGDYASYKLQPTPDRPLYLLAWPAAVMERRIELFAFTCLFGSLILSFLIVVGHNLGWTVTHRLEFPAGIITLLILNVAIRSVQDGLAAPEELERYNEYAGKIRYLQAQFDASGDNLEKLRLMEEMERAAFEELKGFLRSFRKSRFLL